jgi:glycosyltransferase involved in cell wall biosynthesis
VKFSVVMTSLDACANLERCLPVLMTQSFLEFELVVAVRGSLDGSLSVLEMLGRRLPFKLVVVALERVSDSVAFSRAIQVSSGETVLFLADDLLLAPETLARHVAFHAVHDRAVAVAPLEFADGLARPMLRVSWMSFAGANLSASRNLLLELGLNDTLEADQAMLDLGARLEDAGVKFRALTQASARHFDASRDASRGEVYAHRCGYFAFKLAHVRGARAEVEGGLHPGLQLLKRGLLNPLGDAFLGENPTYRFERAFLQGSREARRELEQRELEQRELEQRELEQRELEQRELTRSEIEKQSDVKEKS